jgi:hypothetical protein
MCIDYQRQTSIVMERKLIYNRFYINNKHYLDLKSRAFACLKTISIFGYFTVDNVIYFKS